MKLGGGERADQSLWWICQGEDNFLVRWLLGIFQALTLCLRRDSFVDLD